MSRSAKSATKSAQKKVADVESSIEDKSVEKSVEKSTETKPAQKKATPAKGKAAKKDEAPEKASAEKTSTEKVSAEKASVDKPATEKAPAKQKAPNKEEGEATEKKPKAPRKKPTALQVAADLEEILKLVELEIETNQKNVDGKSKPGIKRLRTIRKKLEKAHSDTKKLPSRRVARENNQKSNKVSGFGLVCKITPELRSFMGLKEGVDPIRSDITNAMCCYVKFSEGENREHMKKWAHINTVNRNLQDPDCKMKIIPDEKLSKLLGYPEYVKNVKEGKITKKVTNPETGKKEDKVVVDPSLRYNTMQFLVQKHVLGTVSAPKAETA